jgi:hypothetical protein
VLLTDELRQRGRPHPGCQGLNLTAIFFLGVREKIGHTVDTVIVMTFYERLMGLLQFCGLVAMVVGPVGFAYWIVCPLNRITRLAVDRLRFSIADFLALCIVFQVMLAFIFFMPNRERNAGFAILAIVAAGLLWWLGVDHLSRAGIRAARHRIAFLSLVMPMAFIGGPVFVVWTVQLATSLLSGRLIEDWFVTSPAAAGWAALGATGWACGKYTRWLVRQAENSRRGWDEQAKTRANANGDG